jgi:hypothetical protein
MPKNNFLQYKLVWYYYVPLRFKGIWKIQNAIISNNITEKISCFRNKT